MAIGQRKNFETRSSRGFKKEIIKLLLTMGREALI